MILIGRHSDQTGERLWHCVLSLIAGAAGMVLIALSRGSTASPGGPGRGDVRRLKRPPAFLDLSGGASRGMAAAAGIALINSVGNLAGFACPTSSES